MIKRYTVNVQMFEVVDEPEKIERGVRTAAAVKQSNRAGDFTVRAETYEGAVQKAIRHLQLELPEPAPGTFFHGPVSQFPGPRGEGELGNR
jgi:hypothetical protein